jgi:hypothetical protein
MAAALVADHAWYDEHVESDEEPDWKENVVREAPLESTTPAAAAATASSTSTEKTTDAAAGVGGSSPQQPSPSAKAAVQTRGCISTTLECTKNTTECRMFEHRKVASVFCRCTPGLCIGVAAHRTADGEFNLQCAMAVGGGSSPAPGQTANLPFYCKFIPFFSYR